jgi:hypothetical protein
MAHGSSVTEVWTRPYQDLELLELDCAFGSDDGWDNYSTSCAVAGYVMFAVTVPYGASPPQAGYNIYIYDKNGVDIFGGTLTGRSHSNVEQATPLIGALYAFRRVSEVLTISCSSNNVPSATFKIFLYIKPGDRWF